MSRSAIFATVALLSLSLFSCNKNNNPGSLPPTDTTGMKISLVLPEGNAIQNCEMIISETAGKILLDTIGPAGSTINARLDTQDTLVDVSLVLLHTADIPQPRLSITTYKAVNPSNWKSLAGSFQPYWGSTNKTVRAITLYRDPPAYINVQFSTLLNGFVDFEYPSPGVLTVAYGTIPGHTTFLLDPESGTYLIRTPKSLQDTVLCDTLRRDTAVTGNLNSSPDYTLISTSLLGVSDSSNIYVAPTLYFFFNSASVPTQLMYPRDWKFQKYLLESRFAVSTNNKEKFYDYKYEDTVDNTIHYPPANAFVIGASQINNFTVTFNGAKPASYKTILTNSLVYWECNASPDSTSLNPLAVLLAQKSKLLQGLDLSTLQLNGFVAEMVPGYGYAQYMGLLCNPALLSTVHLPNYSAYTKTF